MKTFLDISWDFWYFIDGENIVWTSGNTDAIVTCHLFDTPLISSAHGPRSKVPAASAGTPGHSEQKFKLCQLSSSVILSPPLGQSQRIAFR